MVGQKLRPLESTLCSTDVRGLSERLTTLSASVFFNTGQCVDEVACGPAALKSPGAERRELRGGLADSAGHSC